MMRNCPYGTVSRNHQRGAVLFVALVMLIILALLGITGMQIAGMQERMSSNYRANGLAFQNAEGLARNAECVLEELTNRSGPTPGCDALTEPQIQRACETGFEPGGWAGSLNLATQRAVTVREVTGCIAGNDDISVGTEPINENPNPVYEVTAYMTDDPTNPAAATAVDTIFRP